MNDRRPAGTLRPTLALSFALALALAHAAPARAGNDGHWIPNASMSVARQETGAARIGSRVYVVGGLLAGFPLTATDAVEAYDLATGTWHGVAPLPVPLDHAMVAAVGSRLWVIGGFSADFQARSEVWVYDPGVDQWSPGPPLPEPRGAGWAVTHGGLVYVFGGADAADVAQRSTFALDPVAGQWTRLADMPTPREHLNAVVVGEHVYVIGGRAGGSTGANERYHPATDTWTAMAPMPTARSAMAAAALGGRIYAAGGEIPVLFAVNEVYDVATDSWSSQAPMPLPRHGVAAVALEDRILMPGGGLVQGLLPTAAVDAFVPADTCGGVRYCAAVANSTGAAGVMACAGSGSVAANDVRLLALFLPAGQNGLFVYSPDPVQVPLGDGNLCVGSATLGFVPRLPFETSDPTGVMAHALDLTDPTAPEATILPGSTWYFTCWHRDVPAGGAGFNFADGLQIAFGP